MIHKLDELARSFGDISSTYSIAADLASSPEDARLFDALANAYDEAFEAIREVTEEERDRRATDVFRRYGSGAQ